MVKTEKKTVNVILNVKLKKESDDIKKIMKQESYLSQHNLPF